jgi:hypothetical protein
MINILSSMPAFLWYKNSKQRPYKKLMYCFHAENSILIKAAALMHYWLYLKRCPRCNSMEK